MGTSLNVNEEEFLLIKAGETKIDKLKDSQDGYLYDWNDVSGMTLYVILNNVNIEELDNIINTDKGFEIAFIEMKDCGFISVKFGNLPWGEGTFEPCLYDMLDMPYYDDYDTQGMALTICVIDPQKDGLVMGNRIIGLGHDFSMNFSKWVHEKFFDKGRKGVFTKERHYNNIESVWREYTSYELQRKALYRWRLAGKGTAKEREAISMQDDRTK